MRTTTLSRFFALLLIAVGCSQTVAADEPKPGTPQSKFELSTKLVEQSRSAAAAELLKVVDPKQRPPMLLTGIAGLAELKVDLDSPESIRQAVERAIKTLSSPNGDYNERRRHIMLLARVPTPAAFDFLLTQLKSPSISDRRLAVNAVCYAGRWGTPLLIGMLDDATFLETNVVETERYAERTERQEMPERHFVHRMLQSHLMMLGIRGKTINVAQSKERVPVTEDIDRAKEWWSKHGDNYLAGRETPNLVLTTYRFQRK